MQEDAHVLGDTDTGAIINTPSIFYTLARDGGVVNEISAYFANSWIGAT
jgi:hypothetical protein